MKQKRIIFIVGPTAVGKSSAAVYLAGKIKGEIISCDSMQVYKEINIASNKPDEEQLKQVRHHLINVVSVEDDFDVVQFSRLARKAIEEILKRGKVPVIVGGSGLYVSVLLDGIFEDGIKNQELRDALFEMAAEQGHDYLYEELKNKDPIAAEKIHPRNIKRVVRALEVVMTEKKPISSLQKKREGLWGKFDIDIFGLDQDRSLLYSKINERVDQMAARGLVDEIKRLKRISLTARYLIGIKEIKRFIDGECDLEEAVKKIKQNTRHFAKRQLTWFRKDKRIQWQLINEGQSVESIAEEIYKKVNV